MVNLRHDEGLANPRINSQDLDGADHSRELTIADGRTPRVVAKLRGARTSTNFSLVESERSLRPGEQDCGGGSRDSTMHHATQQ